MNVLVVEDDRKQSDKLIRDLRKVLGDSISIFGPYDRFEDVLPYAKQGGISLALVDIQLHDDLYAGINIARMLQTFLSVPILFVSGITDKSLINEAESIANSDFIAKPYDLESLERAIGHVLALFEKRSNHLKIAFQPRGKDKYWIKVDKSKFYLVKKQDILFVRSSDHYCKIYVAGLKSPLTIKAKIQEEIMDYGLANDKTFYKLRREVIVNLDKVEKVEGLTIHIKGLDLSGSDRIIIPKEKKKIVYEALDIPF